MMQLEVSFRKGRANQNRKAWCVDTRSVQSDGGEKFFATKDEARNYSARISKELIRSDSDSWTWTFQELSEVYIASIEKQVREGEQSNSYLNEKVRHIAQFLGVKVNNKPLAETLVWELTTGQIELQLMDQLKVGRSKKTMQNLFGSINKFMKAAKKYGCRETNPCAGVEIKFDLAKPKRKTNPANIQPDVITKIIAAMDPKGRLITSFAAKTGLRQGELRALTWGDIMWNANKVNVDKAFKHQDGIGATKTEAGNRKVPLGKSLKKALQEYFIEKGRPADSTLLFSHEPNVPSQHAFRNQHGKYTKANFAFSKKVGQPHTLRSGSALTHAHFLKAVHQACDDAGVAHITWHDLRHFAASMLLKKHSNDLWEVSKRLGHEQKSTTENIYGHFIEDITEDDEEDLLALG